MQSQPWSFRRFAAFLSPSSRRLQTIDMVRRLDRGIAANKLNKTLYHSLATTTRTAEVGIAVETEGEGEVTAEDTTAEEEATTTGATSKEEEEATGKAEEITTKAGASAVVVSFSFASFACSLSEK